MNGSFHLSDEALAAGAAALAFGKPPAGREQRRRGVNARVVTGGSIRTGDPVVQL